MRYADDAWLESIPPETATDPELSIVDAHHHAAVTTLKQPNTLIAVRL